MSIQSCAKHFDGLGLRHPLAVLIRAEAVQKSMTLRTFLHDFFCSRLSVVSGPL
jgi:hypothetical protein